MVLPFTEGQFRDEDGQAFPHPLFEWALTATFRDLNGDSLPDLFVCNGFHTSDRLWLNVGKGRFRLAPRLALRRTSLFSVAADFADINRDGLDDLFVLDTSRLGHTHHETPFDDFERQPLLPNSLSQLGPGVAWFDVDRDGRDDLVIGAGASRIWWR